MELCCASSSQRTNEQCREPLAIREASMETWQDGIQQQQETHVFWALALCLHIHPALQAQQHPMGSRSHVATLPSTAQMSLSFNSPAATASLPPPQAHSGGPPSLLPLRSGGVGRSSVVSSLSAAAMKRITELLVPRPEVEGDTKSIQWEECWTSKY